MTHEQLVDVSMDRDFELAKEMILQGLSFRLLNFENNPNASFDKKNILGILEHNLLINVTPRIKYPETFIPLSGKVQ